MEDSEKTAPTECTMDDVMVPPPPPYRPKSPKTDVPPPPVYPTAMPLPTYTQSEKFEKEGVLDLSDHGPVLVVDSDCESTSEVETSQSEVDNRGNCCEFIIFFLVTLIFSVVGFIFAICLATTAASQGGALAGFGVALFAKPFLFEFYDKQHIQEYLYANTCQGCSDVEKCQHYLLHGLRLLFWVFGIIGALLIYKGLCKFISTRGSRRRGNTD